MESDGCRQWNKSNLKRKSDYGVLERVPEEFSLSSYVPPAQTGALPWRSLLLIAREMTSIEMAIIDDLTGLANRRGFLMFAEEDLHVADRDGAPGTLLFFDVDGLKAINDQYGHAAGDAAIKQIAGTMKETFRAADILARLAGDEFVVLLHNTNAEEAHLCIERFKNNLGRSSDHGDVPSEPTLACGQVMYDPARHPDIDSLIAEGDARMYAHKESRRGNANHD